MQAIEVTARWDDSGQVTPLRFSQGGVSAQVESVGRQWKDAAGLHVLVQANGGRAYELVFMPAEMRWFMGFAGHSPAVI